MKNKTVALLRKYRSKGEVLIEKYIYIYNIRTKQSGLQGS